MPRFLRLSLVLFVAGLLAAIPACGNSNSGKLKIGVVTNCTADFWSICEAGASKAAADHDVELIFRQPDQYGRIRTDAHCRGVSGTRVQRHRRERDRSERPNADLTRIAKEVPLITMDNDADQTGRLCYIGIDNKEAGKAVGRLVKKALPNGGTIALFIGSTTSANGQARSQGVLDELAGQDNAQGVDAITPSKPNIKGKKFGNYFLVDGPRRPTTANPPSPRTTPRMC